MVGIELIAEQTPLMRFATPDSHFVGFVSAADMHTVRSGDNSAEPVSYNAGSLPGQNRAFYSAFTVDAPSALLERMLSVNPPRYPFLEKILVVTGINIREAVDLVESIERREEGPYAVCMLRSAANSEHWYRELREYLAGYGVAVTKPFQPQEPELASKAAVPVRQPWIYSHAPGLRELKAPASGSRERPDPAIEYAMGRRTQPVY